VKESNVHILKCNFFKIIVFQTKVSPVFITTENLDEDTVLFRFNLSINSGRRNNNADAILPLKLIRNTSIWKDYKGKNPKVRFV